MRRARPPQFPFSATGLRLLAETHSALRATTDIAGIFNQPGGTDKHRVLAGHLACVGIQRELGKETDNDSDTEAAL